MAYNGAKIQKTDEGMCLCFYPVGPLSLLVDESHVGHIYNFYQTFREGEVLSENIISLTSASFPV